MILSIMWVVVMTKPTCSPNGRWSSDDRFTYWSPCTLLSSVQYSLYSLLYTVYTRAHRDWPLRPKIENRDSHTWIFIGNWILMWVCFLHFFDLSTSSAAKMRFYFLPFLQGKRAQNRPENPQNWNLAKIGLKSDNFMK